VQWSWNTTAGVPSPIFQVQSTTADFVWPVAAVPLGPGGTASSIVLLAERVRKSPSAPLGFENVATTVISIIIAPGANPPSKAGSNGLPMGWSYSTCDLPWTGTNGLMWSTALFSANSSLVNGKVLPSDEGT